MSVHISIIDPGAVRTTGNQTVAGNKIFSGQTSFTDATDATNSTTGTAFAGGVGIAKNAYIGANLAAGNPKIVARKTSNTIIAQGGAYTRIPFETVDLDNAGLYASSTGVTTVNGTYLGNYLILVFLKILFSSSTASTSRLDIGLYKNGTFLADIGGGAGDSSTGFTMRANATAIIPNLINNDNFDIRCAAFNSGSGLIITAQSGYLSIVKLP